MKERKRNREENAGEYVHKNIRKLQNETSLDSCSKHGKTYLIENHQGGDLVCTKCGIVICDRMISEEAEWRNFGDDSVAEKWQRSRIGGAQNVLLSDDANLSTGIRFENEASGSGFAASIRNIVKRRSVDKAIIHALDAISTMSTRIHLTDSVINRAHQIYGRCYQQLKLKGNIIFVDAKVPACIYIACRLESCSRSSKEIAAASEISVRELRVAIKRVLDSLKIKFEPLDTSVMIDRYIIQMGLPDDETKALQKKAKIIADQTRDKMNADRCQPESIIGGQILLALHEQNKEAKIKDLSTQIGSVFGVSSGTIARSRQILNR